MIHYTTIIFHEKFWTVVFVRPKFLHYLRQDHRRGEESMLPKTVYIYEPVRLAIEYTYPRRASCARYQWLHSSWKTVRTKTGRRGQTKVHATTGDRTHSHSNQLLRSATSRKAAFGALNFRLVISRAGTAVCQLPIAPCARAPPPTFTYRTALHTCPRAYGAGFYLLSSLDFSLFRAAFIFNIAIKVSREICYFFRL